MGSGNGDTDRFGPDYMLDRDVVLVTINYRLGPLGMNFVPQYLLKVVTYYVCNYTSYRVLEHRGR